MTGSGTAFFCMGSIQAPKIKGIDLFPVNFIRRLPNQWYYARGLL